MRIPDECHIYQRHSRQKGPKGRQEIQPNMGHIVASDAHTDRVRAPRLRQAFETVRRWLGEERADNIFHVHPEAILKNESFQVAEPADIKKKLFHWFR